MKWRALPYLRLQAGTEDRANFSVSGSDGGKSAELQDEIEVQGAGPTSLGWNEGRDVGMAPDWDSDWEGSWQLQVETEGARRL